MKRIFIILFCGLFCISCSHKINKGIVINKEYHPSYVTTSFVMVGKVMVPQVINHPPRYVLIVKDSDIVEKFNVGYDVYESTMINDSVKLKD